MNRKVYVPICLVNLRRSNIRRSYVVFIAFIILAALSSSGHAGHGMRQVIPIQGAGQIQVLPSNAVAMSKTKPLPRTLVEAKLKEVLAAWNTNNMASTLGEELYDSARLTQAVQRNVPKDAKLRLLSVQGVQTLQQYRLEPTANSGGKLVSVVTALANTQLEYQGANGLVSLPGRNEYRLKITQALSTDTAGR